VAPRAFGRKGASPRARESRDPAGARDNWSAAETDRRHLLRGERAGIGPRKWSGPASGPRSSAVRRLGKPVTGRAAMSRERGVPDGPGLLTKHHWTHSSTPRREVRIKSVEGVLGCAYRVTLTGARYNRPWRDGSASTQIAWVCFGTPGRAGPSKERSERHRSRDRGRQTLRRYMVRACLSRKAQGVRGRAKMVQWVVATRVTRKPHATPTARRRSRRG
jgi:hypothetical protein